MSETIKKGDRVHVEYAEHYLCFDATILSTPRGEGDTFQVETDEGKVRILNVYANNLLWVERIA